MYGSSPPIPVPPNSTVMKTLEGEVISQIGETFYNMDATDKYLSQGAAYLYMAKGNRVQHLRRWLTARFLYVDSMFGYLPDVENTIIIRNTMSGLWKIKIKTYNFSFKSFHYCI